MPFLKQENLLKQNDFSENLAFQNLLTEIWPGQFFYYMKLGLSASMFCQIVGRGIQISSFGKNTQVHLVIIREWPKNKYILRNLDNPPVYFIQSPYNKAQKSI